MNISDLHHRSICILGFGREGQSVARALEAYAPEAKITIADRNETLVIEDKTHTLQTGSDWLKGLAGFDVIIKSPGIPPFPEIEKHRKKLTNALQIFLDTIAEQKSLVIGVTGSKGKSTTSSLLAAILKHAGRDVHLVGNIGIPVLDFIEKATKDTVFVVEMSSYQLLDVTTSPHIAVVTSFFPEHLDYHGSLKEYKNAKANITNFQTKSDHVFYADDANDTADIAKKSMGTKHPYTEDDAPVRIEETNLIGTHNLRNIAGAWKVAEHLGVQKEDAIAAIKIFVGLPHRLQHLGTHHGMQWVDDAISTTPESAIAALDALGDDVETLICGGQDRGLDFSAFGKRIAQSKIKTLILFPDTGNKIRDAVDTETIDCIGVCDMEQAVREAKRRTAKGKICLLSTASPSYNMFKNFEEKGELFQREIQNK